ncbi:MAG: hypothetical protein WC806_05850 [Candidatus Gracilibacteria bacterium]|jgi:hypothetical protein
MKFHKKLATLAGISSAGHAVALFSGILLIVGSILSWGVTQNGHLVNGLTGDGKITLVLGILTILSIVIGKGPHIFALIFGIASSIIGIVDFIEMTSVAKTVYGAVGFGLYLSVLAGMGIFVGAIMETIRLMRR